MQRQILEEKYQANLENGELKEKGNTTVENINHILDYVQKDYQRAYSIHKQFKK